MRRISSRWRAASSKRMAFAARVFRQPHWAESARCALEFVRAALWRDDRLLATDGHAHPIA